MKYKITKRLTGYFSVVLLLFSMIAGVLFWALFTWHTAAIHEQELTKRALAIADTLSQFQQTAGLGYGSGVNNGSGGGYGAYLKFIDEVAMSKVWLVDQNGQRIEMGHRGSALSYDNLPEGADALIEKVYQGNMETNQTFSFLPGISTVTVGVPVKNGDGTIFAALLLHSSIDGMEQARRDGILILVFCMSAALILAGGLSVFLARRFISPLQVMSSVTEQIIEGDYQIHTGIRQDDEIGMLAANIDELSDRLSKVDLERKELDKMRQDFVSNISHELRTPVTVMKGSLEVLDQGLVTGQEEVKEYYHQMLSDVSCLQRLVDDLLELSRLQNAGFRIEKIKMNLSDALSEAVRSMRRLAAKKDIEIHLEKGEFPVPFYGDYGRIRQMFSITIDNAVKFSRAGQSVDITLQAEAGGYTVAITDYGEGIAEEDIPHIFERFHREHSERNSSGSGLGLPIASQIAKRHDIEIVCKSRINEGTSFLFLFPDK